MTVIVDKWLQRSGTKKSSQTSPVDKTTNDGQTKVTTVSTFLEIQTNYNITYYIILLIILLPIYQHV